MIDAPQPADRLERGKQRTRAALMRAAQGLIADQAHDICRRPLPSLDDLTGPDLAA